jgi:prepilin-type processing-associated H-X9-DG protein
VFIDESVATVDDGFFAIDNVGGQGPDPYGFQNSPTLRHNKSSTVSYADGHTGKLYFRSEPVDPFPTSAATGAEYGDWINLYLTIYPPPP